MQLILSQLRKTWILDFDGTLVKHNGYKDGCDEWLPGSKEFISNIPTDDVIIILTAREKEAREQTERFLQESDIRYDILLFEMPMGERILLNDSKPSGLKMAYSVECGRDKGLSDLTVEIDERL